MAVSTGLQTLSAEAVETLSASKHEPTWMRDRRLAAWRLSQELALPLGTEEEWRRTDLRGRSWSITCRSHPRCRAVQRREEAGRILRGTHHVAGDACGWSGRASGWHGALADAG